MREIKFRARDTYDEDMVYDIDNARADTGYTTLNEFFRDDRWQFMQFTGLFDKNGKEICEGDVLNYCDKNKIFYIVRYGSYNCNSGYKSLAPQYIGASFYLEVVNQELLRGDLPIYSHNDYAFLYPVTEDFHNFEEYTKNWGLAVIGNIHENPELINR